MYTRSENGAVMHASSGHTLLDLNFNALGMRKLSSEKIVDLFSKAYAEDKQLAVRWLFYAGDIREGMGERHLFRSALPFVAKRHQHLLKFVGEYNRFDSLLPMLDDAELSGPVLNLIKDQFNADLANLKAGRSVSLLGKWLPSINASSKKTRHYAKIVSRALFDSHRTYRNACSMLREYIDVVERKMCSGQWGLVEYSKVPGVAIHRYREAFNKHDLARFTEFNAKVLKGEAKKNAATVSSAELVHSYRYGYNSVKNVDAAIEASWAALPDLLANDYSIIPVCDISESMTNCTISDATSAQVLDAAVGLSLYCARYNKCPAFRNKVMTFSSTPKFVDVDAPTLRENIKRIMASPNKGYSTNITRMFEAYLNALIGSGVPVNAKLPTLVIFSDMEFDREAPRNMGFDDSPTLFDAIRRKFKQYGYDLPRLVLWNLSSRSGGVAVRTNPAGIVMLSGVSAMTMDMIFSNRTDPFDILCDKLNGKRYQQITLEEK